MLHVQLAGLIAIHKLGDENPIELDLERQDLVDWTEGVEHLQTKNTDELYEMLGFKDKKIPFLVSEVDVDSDTAIVKQGDKDGEENAPATQAIEKEPFALRWHQLVGVVKMVECALTSRPLLIMDDVGLGKTLQVLAFFAVMAYYRSYHSEAKRYPGIWGAYLLLHLVCAFT